MSGDPGELYLLHFERPMHHAQHYLGWTNDFDKRIQQHRRGVRERCRITFAFAQLGIPFIVARRWRGNRHLEKALKNRKNNRQLCPICNPPPKCIGNDEHCPCQDGDVCHYIGTAATNPFIAEG